MKQLALEDYRRMIEGASVLALDRHGDKVLLNPAGRVIKLFRCKRVLSSARLYSYAQRFRDNSARLRERGIMTVEVDGPFTCHAIERQLVSYPMLEGITLREQLGKDGDRRAWIGRFAAYLAELHRKGVYFRSLHLGNVLVTPDGAFALIDIADMTVRGRPLGVWKRARNFRPLTRYPEDLGFIEEYGPARFIGTYLEHAGLAGWARPLFHALLARVDRRFAGGA